MSRHAAGTAAYETAAVALAIVIASLSVWGAFLIYRAVKGQRRKRGSGEQRAEAEKPAAGGGGDADNRSKSTGKWRSAETVSLEGNELRVKLR